MINFKGEQQKGMIECLCAITERADTSDSFVSKEDCDGSGERQMGERGGIELEKLKKLPW